MNGVSSTYSLFNSPTFTNFGISPFSVTTPSNNFDSFSSRMEIWNPYINNNNYDINGNLDDTSFYKINGNFNSANGNTLKKINNTNPDEQDATVAVLMKYLLE
jgi:hypothetical protein